MESTNQQTNRSFIDRITDWAEQISPVPVRVGNGGRNIFVFLPPECSLCRFLDEARFGINAYEMLKKPELYSRY